jgi:aquaporin related protein
MELLQALTPLDVQKKLGITLLNDGVTPIQGFGIEYFLGFVLVLVVFGVCDVNRSEVKGLAPVAIGLTITMGHLAVVSSNFSCIISIGIPYNL